MSRQPKYQRIPGRRGFFVVHRLFAGDDHLLGVETTIWLERYRRLAYADLEQFSIHFTDRSRWIALGSGVGALVFIALTVLMRPRFESGSVGATIFFGVCAAVMAIWFFGNLALGRSCTCFVRTAVQTLELPSLNRVDRAVRARSLIAHRVAQAQGAFLGAAADHASLAALAAKAAATSSASSTSNQADTPAPAPGARTKSLTALALQVILLFTTALAVWYDYHEPQAWGMAANLVATCALMIAAIVQMILSRRARMPALALGSGIAVLVSAVFSWIANQTAEFVLSFAAAATQSNVTFVHVYGNVFRALPGENRVVDIAYVSTALVFAIVAIGSALIWVRLAIEPATSSAPAGGN